MPDLFAFNPVPRGERLSTSKSKTGTCLFVLLFLLYIAYTFNKFLTKNVPRINQFFVPLDDSTLYKAPEIAFAFQTGDDLNITIYDESIFSFSFEQVTIPRDPNVERNYTDIGVQKCHPDWLLENIEVYCPNSTTYMQGILYGSPIHMYPRLKIKGCVNSTDNNNHCKDQDSIEWTLMTGRLFIYLKSFNQIDYASGKELVDETPYQSFYYFLIWDMYNRAEQKIQFEEVTMEPDFINTFQAQNIPKLNLIDQNTYVSVVPTNVSQSLFTWWCRMDDESVSTTVVFTTTLDMLSKWGAMWSLLFSMFALYFLRYNRNQYYQDKPHMANFDDKITPLVNLNDEEDGKQKMEVDDEKMKKAGAVAV